jgi:Rac GTPase-activating protein 1
MTKSFFSEKIKRRSFDGSTVDLVVSRQHKLESKRNYLSGIVCDQCKKPVGYCCMYVKCDGMYSFYAFFNFYTIECKLSYHQPCSRQLNMPCLPSVITPKRDLGTFKALRLADFCPESSPKIPHLIVHCVMYLEKSVSDVFLYRTLGDDKQAVRTFLF